MRYLDLNLSNFDKNSKKCVLNCTEKERIANLLMIMWTLNNLSTTPGVDLEFSRGVGFFLLLWLAGHTHFIVFLTKGGSSEL